jgi:hypothetical protein
VPAPLRLATTFRVCEVRSLVAVHRLTCPPRHRRRRLLGLRTARESRSDADRSRGALVGPQTGPRDGDYRGSALRAHRGIRAIRQRVALTRLPIRARRAGSVAHLVPQRSENGNSSQARAAGHGVGRALFAEVRDVAASSVRKGVDGLCDGAGQRISRRRSAHGPDFAVVLGHLSNAGHRPDRLADGATKV